jgi:hypothetical protein
MSRDKIRLSVRAEGATGFKVQARVPGRPAPVHLADFLPEARGQAHAFKTGVVRGLELAAEIVPPFLAAEGRSKEVNEW